MYRVHVYIFIISFFFYVHFLDSNAVVAFRCSQFRMLKRKMRISVFERLLWSKRYRDREVQKKRSERKRDEK